jgi:glycerol kinase
VRAALESIAFQIKDLIDLMSSQSGIEFLELRADGGPTRNGFLMQFQSDMLRKEVVRTDIAEISALGSAFMAGLATGFWKDLQEIESLRLIDKTFQSKMDDSKNASLYAGWKMAVKRAQLY